MALLIGKMSERDSREDVRKAFRQYRPADAAAGSAARISFEDLKRVAAELGEQLTDEELQEMISAADTNKDGCVDADEFWTVLKRGLP